MEETFFFKAFAFWASLTQTQLYTKCYQKFSNDSVFSMKGLSVGKTRKRKKKFFFLDSSKKDLQRKNVGVCSS